MKGARKFITLGVLIALVLTVGIITFTNVPHTQTPANTQIRLYVYGTKNCSWCNRMMQDSSQVIPTSNIIFLEIDPQIVTTTTNLTAFFTLGNIVSDNHTEKIGTPLCVVYDPVSNGIALWDGYIEPQQLAQILNTVQTGTTIFANIDNGAWTPMTQEDIETVMNVLALTTK